MRTRYQVICDCNHLGYIKLSENDQPYSQMYQSYSLENLNGTSYSTTSANWEEVFRKMKIQCPNCNEKLFPNNISG